MAGETKTFIRSMERWTALKQDGNLSVPESEGVTAVIANPHWGEIDTDSTISPSDAHEASLRIQHEGHHLAWMLSNRGVFVELLEEATCTDMDSVLGNENIASVITIGHGNISSLNARCDCEITHHADLYDWEDVASSATHLKQGGWEQRQCGGLSRKFPVPMGAFAVTDARKVRAAIGYFFDPPHPEDEQWNALLQPVSEYAALDFSHIKALGHLGAITEGKARHPFEQESSDGLTHTAS